MKDVISISARALSMLKNIAKQHHTNTMFIGVKSSGCNGFTYTIKPSNEQEIQKGDEIIKKDDLNINICGKSILYILGSKLEWEKTIMSEGFKFNNPNADSLCGCGKSFNPK